MSKEHLLTSAALIVIAACFAPATRAASSLEPTAPRPNIVVFLVDDMGWQDTSVPFHEDRTPFNDHFRTPHMERLAAQGVRFTNAYAAAVCSPTRTAIMTGQNPARHRVTNWTLYPDRDQSGETERLRAPKDWRKQGLQPGDTTLPGILQSAGYVTIHAGKAHWGAHHTPGSDPRNLGFHVNIAGHAAGGPGHYHGEHNYGNQEIGSYTLPWGIPGLEKYHGTSTHLTDATTIEAVAAMERAVKAHQPFYLYLAHYAVHAPIREHRPYIDHYRGQSYSGADIAIPEVEARYASMVEGMDASLGAVLDKLEELKVARQTLVLFASDNGGLSVQARGKTPRGTGANTHNWPLREGKGSAYEGGTRIPMLVSWAEPDPSNRLQQRLPVNAGAPCHQQVICEDFFPAILHWASLPLPADHPIDGRDFTSCLDGDANQAAERPLVFHYPHVWGPRGQGYQPHSAMRLGPWKVIYFYQPQSWELYHVVDDISETDDLAAKRPHRLGSMAKRLVKELDRLGAQYPTNKKTDQPEPPVLPTTVR